MYARKSVFLFFCIALVCFATVSNAQEEDEPIFSPEPTAEPEPATNKGGIAAGSVIGILALIGLAVGGYFLYAKKKKAAVEEEKKDPAPLATEA